MFVFLFWISVFFVLYTYLGYPVLIALIARRWPNSPSYLEISPNVTFLIPAYNEEKYISDKLDNTLSLDYPHEKLQILVIADGSSDRTPEIVKAYAGKGVELIYDPERNGKMAAVIRAIQFSRGEIVVFSDANNMYDVRAIRELILPFSNPNVGGTTGAKLIIEDGRDLSSAEGLYWKYESWIKKNETALGSCTVSVGEILAIRKELFVPPREKVINDDHYIVLDMIRRGYHVVYTPDARSYEYVSQTAKDEFARRLRMNAGLFQTISMSAKLLPFNRFLLLWEIISHKYFRAFVPFAMLAAFALNLVLIIIQNENAGFSFWETTSSFYQIFFVFQLAFYMMAAIGNIVKFRGFLGKVLYLPAFLVNSNFATAAGFYSFLTDNQPHIWKRVRR